MANPAETFTIEKSLPGERFDTFLRTRYPAMSRGAIQRLIDEGHIRINDAPVKATRHPRAGETVTITWPEARPAEAQPEAIPLDILFEDKDLLVINKPAGMVVHPAAGNEEHTLVNALLHHCAGGLSGIGGVARPGVVHRLDKDTSGCLVAAKNDETHLKLSIQFASRQVNKIYHALVCGIPSPAKGDIHGAIARHPTQRKKMAVVDEDDGRDAWTSYRVLEPLKDSALVEATIHTGRTHQIRVHLQHLGFPVAGDATYGAKQNSRLRESARLEIPRVMLHAALLEFTHPRTEKRQTFKAPWPKDFSHIYTALGGKRRAV